MANLSIRRRKSKKQRAASAASKAGSAAVVAKKRFGRDASAGDAEPSTVGSDATPQAPAGVA